MKKSLLVAASLATLTGGIIDSAKASEPTPNFTVTAATPGAITFSGKGTAQFNNSTGTNNSFQVGSSTNLGVNASSSSTAEYGVTGQASLDLAGTTVLKQVIGTSGRTSETTKSRAHDVARTAMSSWSGGASWESGNSNYDSSAEWKAAYDAEYSRNYNNEYSTTAGAETQDNGTISGVFKTTETGSAKASSSLTDYTTAASASADREWGVSYENQSNKGGVTYDNSMDWQAAYDREYNRAYSAASSGASRNTESEVTVNGIGSDANVQAADTSTFAVDIVQNTGQTFGSTATANGSAGASLATSSFANQSQSSTASGFMQAFGGV